MPQPNSPFTPPVRPDIAWSPEPAPTSEQLGDPGRRLLAAIINVAPVLGMATLALFLLFTLPSWGRGGPDNTEIVVQIGAGTMLPLLAFQIYQWHRISTTGQSLGKLWLKLRVVRADGTPPGFLRGVVLRSWVTLLLFVAFERLYVNIVLDTSFLYPLYFVLADSIPLFRPDRRCVHDYIAGTRVITAPSR